MGTKMAVAFASIFLAKIEKEILRQSSIKPIVWKRFIDDVISVETPAKQNRRIPSKGKQLPSYNQIHGWNLRNRSYILGHESLQRCQIQQGFYPWRANTFQAHRDLPIHEFLFVPPTRRHKRFYQRKTVKASKNKFLWNYFWGEHEEFFSTPQEQRLPSNNCRKTPLRGQFLWQKESTRTEKQKCT